MAVSTLGCRVRSRTLGLELAGAKNHKTAVAVLEYYKKEKKIFLLEVFEKVIPRKGESTQTSDEALLELIEEIRPSSSASRTSNDEFNLGVNVPLGLPPCISCKLKTCPMPQKCKVESVKWMRTHSKKMGREFTPYTQRPVEIWVRNKILETLPPSARFEIDETLGGNKAPLDGSHAFPPPSS